MTADKNTPKPEPEAGSHHLLDRSKAHAEALAPLHEEVVKEIGKERADAIFRRALASWSKDLGRQVCQNYSGAPLRKVKSFVQELADQGMEEVTFLKETENELKFHVTGCRAAEFYREAGLAHLGELFLCEADYAAISEIDPDLYLERPQTIMGGAKYCDFTFKRKTA